MDVNIIQTVILIVIGVYEVISRIIPTIGDWTIAGNIIKFLKMISDFLNNIKK